MTQVPLECWQHFLFSYVVIVIQDCVHMWGEGNKMCADAGVHASLNRIIFHLSKDVLFYLFVRRFCDQIKHIFSRKKSKYFKTTKINRSNILTFVILIPSLSSLPNVVWSSRIKVMLLFVVFRQVGSPCFLGYIISSNVQRFFSLTPY